MPRPSNGVNLTVDQLERMLNQRRRELSRLTRKRATAQRRLEDIDDRIRRLGGTGGVRGGGRRARNEQSLVEVIHQVLQKAARPLRVSAIAESVSSAGYRSTSDNFRGIVNQMLIKDPRFTSQNRGFYQLKK
ncbi:MAG TPA: HTH domain-containing protein [Tepidisphaeraceae bacterium]|nr:HTH domain-containing protein [Tepidisphaeraceae bacterium]